VPSLRTPRAASPARPLRCTTSWPVSHSYHTATAFLPFYLLPATLRAARCGSLAGTGRRDAAAAWTQHMHERPPHLAVTNAYLRTPPGFVYWRCNRALPLQAWRFGHFPLRQRSLPRGRTHTAACLSRPTCQALHLPPPAHSSPPLWSTTLAAPRRARTSWRPNADASNGRSTSIAHLYALRCDARFLLYRSPYSFVRPASCPASRRSISCRCRFVPKRWATWKRYTYCSLLNTWRCAVRCYDISALWTVSRARRQRAPSWTERICRCSSFLHFCTTLDACAFTTWRVPALPSYSTLNTVVRRCSRFLPVAATRLPPSAGCPALTRLPWTTTSLPILRAFRAVLPRAALLPPLPIRQPSRFVFRYFVRTTAPRAYVQQSSSTTY